MEGSAKARAPRLPPHRRLRSSRPVHGGANPMCAQGCHPTYPRPTGSGQLRESYAVRVTLRTHVAVAQPIIRSTCLILIVLISRMLADMMSGAKLDTCLLSSCWPDSATHRPKARLFRTVWGGADRAQDNDLKSQGPFVEGVMGQIPCSIGTWKLRRSLSQDALGANQAPNHRSHYRCVRRTYLSHA